MNKPTKFATFKDTRKPSHYVFKLENTGKESSIFPVFSILTVLLGDKKSEGMSTFLQVL